MGIWRETSRSFLTQTRLFKIFSVGFRSEQSGKEGLFDVIETRNWVNIVPVTSDDHVLLVEQFRYGSAELSLEFPAGVIEEGQTPIDAAIRELREETGGEGIVTALGSCRPNPAFQSNHCYLFCAESVDVKHSQEFDHFEEIQLVKVPLADIEGMIESGRISHSLSIVAWHKYCAYKDGGSANFAGAIR